MKMLRSLLPACALFLPCTLPAATFEGKVTMKITSQDSNGPQTISYSLKDGLARFDVTGAHGGAAVIMDTGAHQMTILMPQQQMYMVRPLPQAQAAQAQQQAAHDSSFEPTGEKETILGYECTKYTDTTPKEVTELWVTDQLGFFAGMTMGGGPGGRGQAPRQWEEVVKGKGFFPLRVVTKVGGKEKFRMEAVSIDKQPLPDSTFQAPEGWRKFDMGAMMGGMGFPGSH
jgi:hypothetical protein